MVSMEKPPPLLKHGLSVRRRFDCRLHLSMLLERKLTASDGIRSPQSERARERCDKPTLMMSSLQLQWKVLLGRMNWNLSPPDYFIVVPCERTGCARPGP